MKKIPVSTILSSYVLLEATRLDKEFQFLEVEVTKTYPKKVKYFYRTPPVYTSKSKKYEFKWRQVGSSKWGRTELMNDDGEPMRYSKAIKTFFEALNYSENMEFKEL